MSPCISVCFTVQMSSLLSVQSSRKEGDTSVCVSHCLTGHKRGGVEMLLLNTQSRQSVFSVLYFFFLCVVSFRFTIFLIRGSETKASPVYFGLLIIYKQRFHSILFHSAGPHSFTTVPLNHNCVNAIQGKILTLREGSIHRSCH